MIDLRAEERAQPDAQATCAYCRDTLAGALTGCPGCATQVHAECGEEFGKCPVLGCGQPLRVARASDAPSAAPAFGVSPQGAQARRERDRGSMRVPVFVGLACLALAAWAFKDGGENVPTWTYYAGALGVIFMLAAFRARHR